MFFQCQNLIITILSQCYTVLLTNIYIFLGQCLLGALLTIISQVEHEVPAKRSRIECSLDSNLITSTHPTGGRVCRRGTKGSEERSHVLDDATL